MTFNRLYKLILESNDKDTQYLAAVEVGDMKAVQQMVDDAARAAWYDVGPVSHATNVDFTEFLPTRRGRFGAGMYFSDKYYSSRGKRDVRVYLKNPKVTEIPSPWKRDNQKWKPPHNEYFVTNPNQIKSADPVTRDDSGNIIPLSQRFDSTKDDIRY
jgi:hypothetical protein